MTIESLFETYLEVLSYQNYSDATIKGKRTHMNVFFSIIDKTKDIKDISERDIQEFVRVKQQTVKPVSVNSYLRPVRAFLNWCFENGYCKQKIPVRMLKVKNEVIKTYSTEELGKLLEKPNLRECTFTELRNWTIVNFLVATGCRRSTLINVKIKDVKMKDNLIEFNYTKTGKPQVVALPIELKKVLIEYLPHRQGDEDDYLFCTVYGEQITTEGLKTIVAKYNKSRGVNKTSIHAFRHTFAKIAILDCHVDAFVLKNMLAHQSIKTTENYVKLFDTEVIRQGQEFNPLNYVKKNSETKKHAIKMAR